jgi:hypothetical protein
MLDVIDIFDINIYSLSKKRASQQKRYFSVLYIAFTTSFLDIEHALKVCAMIEAVFCGAAKHCSTRPCILQRAAAANIKHTQICN